MSKHGPARAAAAAAAVVALAGCGGSSMHTVPDVPGDMTAGHASAATSSASGVARAGTGQQGTARPGATSAGGARQGAASFVQANSIPFPVAIGNTWVYRTTAGGQAGRTTNRIIAAGAGPHGYEVTMSSTTDVAGTATTVEPVYVFYPDGTIGYPVPLVDGVSVTGDVRWPDAAGLASGRVYHSVLRVQSGQGGQYHNAEVTVHGAGTASVSVPAGTYRAGVVDTTITTEAITIEVITWIAQGVGPVKTEVLVQAAGATELITTSELISFTKGTTEIGS